MRLILLAFLPLTCAITSAQQPPSLPTTGVSIEAFIPARWLPLDTAIADLNRDAIPDVAIVLQCLDTIPGDTTGMSGMRSFSPPRKLVVLFGTGSGFTLGLNNDRFILRADEGGMFDPFEGVHIEDGNLLLYFYGGSNERYSSTYTFRHGAEGFALIAAKVLVYFASTGQGTSHSLDFLDHRMRVETGNMTNDDPGNTTSWKELPELSTRSIVTFVRPFTWTISEDLTL